MTDKTTEYDYLLSIGFEKYLKQLTKQLKGKTVLIYGAGVLFQTAYENFDFSGLNIIGISDSKYTLHNENETLFGYRIYSLFEIENLKPDYIIVATKRYIEVIEYIYNYIHHNTRIKIKPLFRVTYFKILKHFCKEFFKSIKCILLIIKNYFINFIRSNAIIFNFFNIGAYIIYYFNNKDLIKFLHHNAKNKVLVTDPLFVHGELLPGIVKYLKDLKYDVEVLIRHEKNNENPLNMFKNIKIFSVNEGQYYKILKSNKLNEYKHVIITSSRIYDKWNPCKFIFDYYKIDKINFSSLIIEHHMEQLTEQEKKLYKFMALPVFSDKFNLKMVNTHYYGDYNIPTKKDFPNGKVKFIITGDLRKDKKNPDLLIDACNKLIKKGINNFEVKVIGSRHWFDIIDKKLDEKIIEVGRLSYDKMYKLAEETDYIIALFDPYNNAHKRYITNGTSGIYQLSYGFLKPLIINELYAYPHNLTKENSIIYTENNLAEAMEFAIKETPESYLLRVKNLSILEKDIYNQSLKNLEELLNEKQ